MYRSTSKTMRRFTRNALIVAALAALPTRAPAEGPPISGDFEATEVSPGVHVIHGPTGLPDPFNQGFMNNPAFIVTGEGVVIIDPGSSVQVGRLVLDLIRETTDQPVVAAFGTHIHGDHWLGNDAVRAAWPEARLMAHGNLIDEAEAGAAEWWLELMASMTDGATDGTRAVIADERVSDGDEIAIGQYTFTIHHKGKAHTASDIAILVRPGNVLFAGDLVLNARLARMDDGYFKGMMVTLAHLDSLGADVVVPGHGQTAGRELLDQASGFYRTLYDAVEAGFEEGMGDFEIKPLAVGALGDYADWGGFEDGIGRVVSLLYLEIEEENF